MVHFRDLWFKHCLGLCLIFPVNGLKFNTQKFSKAFEMLFLKFHSNLFWPQSTLKRCSFDQFWRICLTLPGNDLNFVSQKFTKKKKNTIFELWKRLLLTSRWLQNHLTDWFPWQTLNLNLKISCRFYDLITRSKKKSIVYIWIKVSIKYYLYIYSILIFSSKISRDHLKSNIIYLYCSKMGSLKTIKNWFIN